MIECRVQSAHNDQSMSAIPARSLLPELLGTKYGNFISARYGNRVICRAKRRQRYLFACCTRVYFFLRRFYTATSRSREREREGGGGGRGGWKQRRGKK